MEHNINSEKKNDLDGPRFSILIPFSPVMANPKLLFNLLKSAVDKAEKEIAIKYSKKQGFPLIMGLRELIKGIKPVKNEKTMAILVSRFKKNIYYFTPTKVLDSPSANMRNRN